MMAPGVMPNIPILENMLEGLCKRKSFDQVKDFLKFVLDGGGVTCNCNECQSSF